MLAQVQASKEIHLQSTVYEDSFSLHTAPLTLHSSTDAAVATAAALHAFLSSFCLAFCCFPLSALICVFSALQLFVNSLHCACLCQAPNLPTVLPLLHTK